MMKAKKIEEHLALLAAVVILVGVSSAANTALAEETANVTTTAIAAHDVANSTLAIAAEANTEAAARAARSLVLETGIDLDIQLKDPSSKLIAGAK